MKYYYVRTNNAMTGEIEDYVYSSYKKAKAAYYILIGKTIESVVQSLPYNKHGIAIDKDNVLNDFTFDKDYFAFSDYEFEVKEVELDRDILS